MRPEQVWQQVYAPEALAEGLQPGGETYAAVLPDGRRILLPLRVLPGGHDRAVASLIVNQASFAVLDALAEALLVQVRGLAPEIVVGVPTLGLTLAEALARRLGHARLVPLSTSRKFWYDEALSEPMRSITTAAERRVYLDPRMLPLLARRRVLLVDDVLSTGASIGAVLRLLAAAGVMPAGIACAMLQGGAWAGKVAELAPGVAVAGAIRTPMLRRAAAGWMPEP